MKTIVRMLYGSHMYGTNTPLSDLDYKGVFIPSADDILLQRAKGSIGAGRPKEFGEKNKPGEVDIENYSLQRFLQLCAEGQTVGIDMLFAPDSVILESSPLWKHIQANKGKLLSRRSAAFVGYCRAQGNKYGVKGSRVAAARAAVELFEREMSARGMTAKIEEIEGQLKQLVGEHSEIKQQSVNKAGDLGTFFVCCNRMANFDASLKHGYEIFKRVFDSYGTRAKMAETNVGVDWKALSHAVRVGTEAVELMTTGKVTLPLPNAEHVLAIKQGKVPYKEVAEDIEQLLADVEVATESCILPEKANQDFIDDLVRDEYLCEIMHNYNLAKEINA